MSRPVSFDLAESARLLAALLGTPPAAPTPLIETPPPPPVRGMPPAPARPGPRSEELDRILSLACRRGGFKGAVLADDQGLPLAVHRGPVATEVLAAFTSVLGEALSRAGALLNQREASYISMDADYRDKLVLKRFPVGRHQFNLMLIAPQGADERSDLELAIGQIRAVMGE